MRVFTRTYYNGDQKNLPVGTEGNLTNLGGWNDTIGSVKVPSYLIAEFWKDINFRGKKKTKTENDGNISRER